MTGNARSNQKSHPKLGKDAGEPHCNGRIEHSEPALFHKRVDNLSHRTEHMSTYLGPLHPWIYRSLIR